jgi:IclR family acetate operon transcriptional repressor
MLRKDTAAGRIGDERSVGHNRTDPSPRARGQAAPGRAGVDGVPAVSRAMEILMYLRDRNNVPASMTEIAPALGMNPSTCFNILTTLRRGRILGYDQETRRYELGLGLSELGALVRVERQVVPIAMEEARELTRALGLATLIVRRSDDDHFLIVDAADTPEGRPIRLAVSVGERFEPNSAVFAKAYYAWSDEDALTEMVERHGLSDRSPRAITQLSAFRAEVAEVRRRGYATSVGEYYQESNATSAAIFDAEGKISHLVVVTGFASELPPRRLDEVGRRVYQVAKTITERVGGVYPHLENEL